MHCRHTHLPQALALGQLRAVAEAWRAFHGCRAAAGALEPDEALTPVSALAAILPGNYRADASPTPSASLTLPTAAATAMAQQRQDPRLLDTRELQQGVTGQDMMEAWAAVSGGSGARPAGGWGGITARLQKLRADLRETQARLHDAKQVRGQCFACSGVVESDQGSPGSIVCFGRRRHGSSPGDTSRSARPG